MEDDRLTILVQDDFFPAENAESFLITNKKELVAFYSNINKTRKPGLPIPNVDFSTQIVIGVCLGEVKTDKLPAMTISQESQEQITITVKMEEDKGREAITSFPFCLYSLVNNGKEVLISIP